MIRDDVGGAPNHAPPAATLVICKPQIRKGAKEGDLVLAYNGARVTGLEGPRRFPDPNSVRWAGIISEVMSMAEYWRDPRFASKKPGRCGMPDNIYRPAENGFVQEINESHGPESHARDTGGRNSLVFERVWYFGETAPSLPARFGLWMGGARGGGRQGHRCPEVGLERRAELERWLDSQAQVTPPRPKPSAGTRSDCGPAATLRMPAKVRCSSSC